jgi:hypothetical protein
MSEYVTAEDLDEPVCECGHPAELHPETAGSDSYHATWSVYRYVKCSCAKTREGVRLARLDSIVRREVAKALRSAADKTRDMADVAEVYDGGKLASWDALTDVENFLHEWADTTESGGQS